MIRFAVIILFLATAVVLFLTQTNPSFNETKSLKLEKQSFDEALQYSRELQALRDDLLGRYNAVSREDIERLAGILPSEASSGELIIMLEDRVKSRGLLLKKIDVNEKRLVQDPSAPIGVPPLPFRTIDLSLSISGPYDSFLAFLEDLEKSLRVIDVDQIDFAGGTGGTIEFKVSARTYAAISLLADSNIVASGAKGQEAREILTMLARLKAVKIDSDFFQGDIFKSLQEFAPIVASPTDYGRPNPFIPAQ